MLLDLDHYPMNYWLGRASYTEKDMAISAENQILGATEPSTELKKNVAHVFVSFDLDKN